MKSNFLKHHVITKIEQLIEEKRKITSSTNFYYFDESIKDGTSNIDRVSRFNPFLKEEIVPIAWFTLGGSSLISIYDKLKSNEFFFYKIIDGKKYKIRLKKNLITKDVEV